MSAAPTKQQLSPARQRLVCLFQAVNFGRIESLSVFGGEPILDTRSRVVREVKLGAESGPRPEVNRTDVPLKAEHVALFASLDALGDGVVESIEVRHGLPFMIRVAGAP